MSNLDFYCCCFFPLDGSQAVSCSRVATAAPRVTPQGNAREPGGWKSPYLQQSPWQKLVTYVFAIHRYVETLFWTLVSGVATCSPRQLRWKRSWKYLNVSCFALFVLEQNQKRNDPPLSTQDNNSLICSTDRLWCEVLFRTFKLLYWQLGLIGVCVMRLVSDLNPLMMLTRSIADT